MVGLVEVSSRVAGLLLLLLLLLFSWFLVRCGYHVGAYGLTDVRCWGFLVRLWGCPGRSWCDIGAMMFRYDIFVFWNDSGQHGRCLRGFCKASNTHSQIGLPEIILFRGITGPLVIFLDVPEYLCLFDICEHVRVLVSALASPYTHNTAHGVFSSWFWM